MFDRNEQHTTESHLHHSGSGDNVARDKIIHQHLYGLVDFQQLVQDIKDAEELLAAIAPNNLDLRLKQSAKVEELKQRLEEFKEDVFRLHEIFTRIPINTERLRKAKAHFDKGEFREADAVLKADEIQQDVKRLKLEKRAAQEKLEAIEQDLEERANEYLLKARLSLLNPVKEGEDRFKRTEGYFEQALAAARTVDALFEYGEFLQKHHVFSKAKQLYKEALEQLRQHVEIDQKIFLCTRATILNSLANVHADMHEYDRAVKKYEKALKINQSLAESEGKVFLEGVAVVLNNLAILHGKIGEYSLAEQEYVDALEIYRRLSQKEPEAFLSSIADTSNNLANLHSTIQKYDLAQKEYNDALKIRRNLAKSNPNSFLSGVAETLHNLARLHAEMQIYEPAVQEYEEALEIKRDLCNTNPKSFFPCLALTLNNLGNLYNSIQEYGSAEQKYEEALKIYRSLNKNEPKAFRYNLAMIQNNLGKLYYDQQKHDLALKEFKEALKIRRDLSNTDPKAFLQDMVETLINLSIFYVQAVPDKIKSADYVQEAYDILMPICQQAPHLQKYLDHAEGLLEFNKAKPEA